MNYLKDRIAKAISTKTGEVMFKLKGRGSDIVLERRLRHILGNSSNNIRVEIEDAEREVGYYWVKTQAGWVVSYWTGKGWYMNGYSIPRSDYFFDEIDENKLTR